MDKIKDLKALQVLKNSLQKYGHMILSIQFVTQ